MYAGSVAVHVALILVGVAYSFWHVEELSPPRLKLTFMSAAPPPPPPPPPPGGGSNAPKKKVPKVRPVEQKPTAIVQPKDTPKVVEPPKEEPKPGDGVKGGEIGGKIGGEIGGKIGGEIGGKIGGDRAARSAARRDDAVRRSHGATSGAALQLSGGDAALPGVLAQELASSTV